MRLSSRRRLPPALIAGAALFLLASQQLFAADRYPTNAAELKQVFAEADANPYEYYFTFLSPGFYDIASVGTLTLTKGVVFVYGVTNLGSSWRFVLSGGDSTQVISLKAADGYRPYLSLRGLRVVSGRTSSGFGAGIAVVGGSVNLDNAYVGYNSADWQGSGMFLGFNSSAYIFHSMFDNNRNGNLASQNCGGGVIATGGGLALFGDSSTQATVVETTFKNNAACRGGAISTQGGSQGGPQLYLYNSSLLHNEALYQGGGLFADSNGRLDIYFTTIARNSAATVTNIMNLEEERGGGGISFSGFRGNLYLGASIIALNSVSNPSRRRSAGQTFNNSDCQATNNVSNQTTRPNDVGVIGNIIGKRDRCNFLGSTSWFGIGTDSNPVDPQLQPTIGVADSLVQSVARPVEYGTAFWSYGPTSSPGNGRLALDCRYTDQLGEIASNPCSAGAIEYASSP